MAINLTDELNAATKKGKIASAKQVYLEGDQENLQQIGDKTHQLEQSIKDISSTGGASTANAVSYNNETSGMTAVNAQAAIDELSAKNKAQDSTIATKADAADVTSKMQTEQTRVNAELEKKFDKNSIVQETGNAEDKVMSQKAVSDKLSNLNDKIEDNEGSISSLQDATAKLNKDKVSKDDSDTSISDNSEEFAITDSANKIALKVDKDGVKARLLNICDESGNVVKAISKETFDKIDANENDITSLQNTTNQLNKDKVSKDDSDTSISDNSEEFAITDSANKIALKVDKDGVKARLLNICDESGNVVKAISKETFDKIDANENDNIGRTCLLQECRGTYYEILNYSVSGNIKASVDTNIAKFNRSIRVECDDVEVTDDSNTASRGIITMDFTENPIKVNETLSFWYFIPTKYWRPSQITGSSEKKSVDVIKINVYNGEDKIYDAGLSFSQWSYNVGWNLFKLLTDDLAGKTITKMTFEFVSFNNNPNFQVWIGQFVADQRMQPILNFNMDNSLSDISYTSGFADWLLENNFPVDLRINNLKENVGEDPGFTVVRKLYKRGLANAMPYSDMARTKNLQDAVEYLLNGSQYGRLTSLYSANSERDVVAVGNSTNFIDDTLLLAERLAGYKIMRASNAYCYTSYMDKETCVMQTYGIGAIPSEEPEDVDTLIEKRIQTAKDIIDNAIKYGLAINFFTHQVAKKSQKGENEYNYLASYYEAVTAILSYAKEKEKQGQLRIISMYNISKELQL